MIDRARRIVKFSDTEIGRAAQQTRGISFIYKDLAG
jgi:hypothetical protein